MFVRPVRSRPMAESNDIKEGGSDDENVCNEMISRSSNPVVRVSTGTQIDLYSNYSLFVVSALKLKVSKIVETQIQNTAKQILTTDFL